MQSCRAADERQGVSSTDQLAIDDIDEELSAGGGSRRESGKRHSYRLHCLLFELTDRPTVDLRDPHLTRRSVGMFLRRFFRQTTARAHNGSVYIIYGGDDDCAAALRHAVLRCLLPPSSWAALMISIIRVQPSSSLGPVMGVN